MKNFKNETRKIGIELEFYGLSPKKVADELAIFLKGKSKELHEALYEVQTDLGVFEIELDAKIIKDLALSSKKNKEQNKTDFDGMIKDFLKPLSDEVVPTELITPPIEVNDISLIIHFCHKLKQLGAKGTGDSFRFAFAAQLNPDLKSLEPEHILSCLRSFILLSDWLKAQISMDLTRVMTSYAGDFPKEYIIKILNSNYKPTLKELIKDYLEYNPTRNRSLDMLPLFKFLDAEMIETRIQDTRVKARPTFHYRLPNCQISQKSWNIGIEWKRWLVVEDLADDQRALTIMSEHYLSILKGQSDLSPSDWLQQTNNYVEDLRK